MLHHTVWDQIWQRNVLVVSVPLGWLKRAALLRLIDADWAGITLFHDIFVRLLETVVIVSVVGTHRLVQWRS